MCISRPSAIPSIPRAFLSFHSRFSSPPHTLSSPIPLLALAQLRNPRFEVSPGNITNAGRMILEAVGIFEVDGLVNSGTVVVKPGTSPISRLVSLIDPTNGQRLASLVRPLAVERET